MIDRTRIPEELAEIAQSYFSDSDLNELLREQDRFCREHIASEGSMMPFAVVITFTETPDKREHTYVGFADLPDRPDRYKLFQDLGVKFAEENKKVVAFCFCSEAFMAAPDLTDKEKNDYRKGKLNLKDHPKSKDVVVIMASTIDLRVASAEIPLDKKDKLYYPTETLFDDYQGDKGRTTGSAIAEGFFEGYLKAQMIQHIKEKETGGSHE